MFVSKFVPVIGALFAGVQASPAPYAAPVEIARSIAAPKLLAGRTASSTAFDLSKTLNQATLYDGLAPSTNGATADVDLHVNIPNAVINGNVDVQLGADFVIDPTVTIDLSGVQAYVELDIKADAEVYVSVELVTSDKLSLDIPGLLDAKAALALALDLVICLDAAIELSAGLYIDFPQGSFVKVNLLTSTVVDHVLNDLVTKALPLSLGVEVDLDAEVTLQIGLRLRTELGIDADVDPLGIPLLSAGADVAVWVNLCDYTSVIIGNPAPNCTTGIQESLSLDVGVIVDLDADVLNILDLSLAPTISVTLAAAPASTSCVAACACTDGMSSIAASTNTVVATTSAYTSASATTSAYASATTSAYASATTSASDSAYASASASSFSSVTASSYNSSASSPTTTTTSTEKGATSAYTVTSVDYYGSTDTATVTATDAGNGYGGKGASTSTDGAITGAPKSSLTTSTYYETTTMTITSCAASVVNCPASFTQKVVTEIVYAKTTVCPVAGPSSAVHWSGNATSTATFVIPTASLTSDTAKITTYPATSAPANTFTAPTTITVVVPTVTLTGTPQTVIPVAATTGPAVIVGSTAPLAPVTLVTVSSSKTVASASSSSSKTGTGASASYSLPVTAGAGKLVSHAGAFVALAAGLMLAF